MFGYTLAIKIENKAARVSPDPYLKCHVQREKRRLTSQPDSA
jgi:hypothetical protein